MLSAACGAMLVLTCRQVEVWKNDRALFEQVVKVRPDSFLGYLKLGNECFSADDPGKALGYYLKALERRQDVPLLFNNAGILYSKQNDHIKAIELYDKALLLDPRFSEAHYNKALSYIDMGQGEKALLELGEAAKDGYDQAAVETQAARARAFSGKDR